MKKRLSLLFAAILACTSLTLNLPAVAALPVAVEGQTLPTLAPMLERVTPAVVNIATESRIPLRRNPLLEDPFFRHFFDMFPMPRERRVQSLGSGVVVDARSGYVITNHHVVDQAQTITVTLRDGRQVEAKVIGSDPATDIAVIQIPAQSLTALRLADSDELRVGDFVVAIGNPFGLGQTVTSGIISALGRTGLGIEGYEDFIQTDASINPGNSGGALVNLRGELVGINTAILAPSGGNVGIGFAIPANLAKGVMQQLVEYGQVERGQLGVLVQDLTPQLAQAFGIPRNRGAVIARVAPNSAADRAGLKTGDVVVAVNGKPIRNASDLRNTVGLLRIGERVRLDILREGKAMTITARIGEQVSSTISGERINPHLAGATFSEIDQQSSRQGISQGVLVADVEPGSPAAQAGLRRGDIITSVNRRSVSSLNEFQQAAARGNALLLNIQRGRASLFIVIR